MRANRLCFRTAWASNIALAFLRTSSGQLSHNSNSTHFRSFNNNVSFCIHFDVSYLLHIHLTSQRIASSYSLTSKQISRRTSGDLFKDGIWPQLGQDLEYETDINVNELGSIAITPGGKRVAVGEGVIGKVTIYDYISDIDGWVAVGELSPGLRFGKSVALSTDGNRIIVGNYAFNEFTGIAQVFDYNATTMGWDQIGQDISGDVINDWAGYSVSISGDGERVAIGIPFSDPNNEFSTGVVRVYHYRSDSWVQLGGDIVGEAEGDRSGIKVAMSEDGNTLAIAASFNDAQDEAGNFIRNTGQIRVYELTTILIFSRWQLKGNDIDGLSEYIGNPLDVAISPDGNQVVIGYPTFDNDKGQVAVYRYIDGMWTLFGNLIEGEFEDILFGTSVSMSAEGCRLMIGAPGAVDSTQKGVGFVYQYLESNNTWGLASSETSTECFATAMSADGTTVATMSTSFAQVFKFEAFTEAPSNAPTTLFAPSSAPSTIAPTIVSAGPALPWWVLLLPLLSLVLGTRVMIHFEFFQFEWFWFLVDKFWDFYDWFCEKYEDFWWWWEHR